jgi:hypothetical protein
MNSDKYLFTQVELSVKSHDKGARTASFSIIGHQTYLPKTQGQAFSFNNKVHNSNTATTLQIGNEVPKKINK